MIWSFAQKSTCKNDYLDKLVSFNPIFLRFVPYRPPRHRRVCLGTSHNFVRIFHWKMWFYFVDWDCLEPRHHLYGCTAQNLKHRCKLSKNEKRTNIYFYIYIYIKILLFMCIYWHVQKTFGIFEFYFLILMEHLRP